MFVWAKLRGTPVYWPVKVVTRTGFNAKVYIKSDNAELTVKLCDVRPFHRDLVKLKQDGIATLNKKCRLKTLQCFLADVDWALLGDCSGYSSNQDECVADPPNRPTDDPVPDVDCRSESSSKHPVSCKPTTVPPTETDDPVHEVHCLSESSSKHPVSCKPTTDPPTQTDDPVHGVDSLSETHSKPPVSCKPTTDPPTETDVHDVHCLPESSSKHPVSCKPTTDPPIETDDPVHDVHCLSESSSKHPVFWKPTTDPPTETDDPVHDVHCLSESSSKYPVSWKPTTDPPTETDVPVHDVHCLPESSSKHPVSCKPTTDPPIETDDPVHDVHCLSESSSKHPVSWKPTTDPPTETDVPVHDVHCLSESSSKHPVSWKPTTDPPTETDDPVHDVHCLPESSSKHPVSCKPTTDPPTQTDDPVHGEDCLSETHSKPPVTCKPTTDPPTDTDDPVHDVDCPSESSSKYPVSCKPGTDPPTETDDPVHDVHCLPESSSKHPVSCKPTTDPPAQTDDPVHGVDCLSETHSKPPVSCKPATDTPTLTDDPVHDVDCLSESSSKHPVSCKPGTDPPIETDDPVHDVDCLSETHGKPPVTCKPTTDPPQETEYPVDVDCLSESSSKPPVTSKPATDPLNGAEAFPGCFDSVNTVCESQLDIHLGMEGLDLPVMSTFDETIFNITDSEDDDETTDTDFSALHIVTKKLPNKRTLPVHDSDDSSDEESIDDGHKSGQSDEGVEDTANIDSDHDNVSDIEESSILRDEVNPGIYVSKVLKSKEKKTKQKRKGDRVYNSYHACFYCNKTVQHIRSHLKAKHKTVSEVAVALKKKDNKELSKLRSKGDDQHNADVVKNKKGELFLMRRPVKDFRSSEYGPCPNCREWIRKTTIRRHQKKCIAKNKLKQTKQTLLIQSDILSGRFQSTASKLLREEVFSIMTCDEITRVAQNDPLIVSLGESWLRRNIDNKAKRKYYSSQRMRLNARFLIELRNCEKNSQHGDSCVSEKMSKVNSSISENECCEQDEEHTMDSTCMQQLDENNSPGKTFWDFIIPHNFDKAATAALRVALPEMDDEEDLRSPSNAIKLKYDLRKLVSIKWAYIMKNGGSKKASKQCEDVLNLINMEWAERVTKLARSILIQRQFLTTKEIPNPDDIKMLNEHVICQLKATELKGDIGTYRDIVGLVQTRLLSYNKRRSGEIDAISLKDFCGRRKDLNDVDESLVRELSDLEKHLLKSQDLMIVRGKRCRPVPVLIPQDAKEALMYLAGADVRKKVGIQPSNTFLFPTSGNGAARSYESMKNHCKQLNLRSPERITSVALRKYTATLSQVMNLENNQLQWLCRHLGHTKRVHLEHYRQMSGFIERVEISKILLVQDMNLTEKFKGKKLHEVDLQDLLSGKPEDETPEAVAGPSGDNCLSNTRLSDDEPCSTTKRRHSQNSDNSFSDISEDGDDVRPRKKAKRSNRLRWTVVEVEELQKYFRDHLKSKTTPGKKECLRAIEKSRLSGTDGQLHRRNWHTIVKKISNLNRK